LADVDLEPGRGAGDQKSILVVDDRADVLEALCMVAGELGYACHKAASAGAAANQLAARKYDLVLIDLDMPVKRGDELASETRRGAGPDASSRLLAMSASEMAGEGGAWPFDGFLQKPIDRLALRKAIELRRPA
jgi:CheY-like chemotaxis protein